MPDFREEYDDPMESNRTMMEGLQKQIWTAMPVIVAEDSDGHTVTLRIALKASQMDKDGKVTKVDYPLLKEVPIQFPGGGGMYMTFPVKKGDEGMVVFMSRAQDSFFEQGDVANPIDSRMHSMSDGRYIPGGFSKPNKLVDVSATGIQIRSKDGKTSIGLDGTTIKLGGDNATNVQMKVGNTSVGVDSNSGVSVSSDKAMAFTSANGATTAGIDPAAGTAFLKANNGGMQVLVSPTRIDLGPPSGVALPIMMQGNTLSTKIFGKV